MPKFSTAVPNPLGKDTARSAVEGLLSRVTEKYGDQVSALEQSWEGDTLNFAMTTYGFKITGNLVVEDEGGQDRWRSAFCRRYVQGKNRRVDPQRVGEVPDEG